MGHLHNSVIWLQQPKCIVVVVVKWSHCASVLLSCVRGRISVFQPRWVSLKNAWFYDLKKLIIMIKDLYFGVVAKQNKFYIFCILVFFYWSFYLDLSPRPCKALETVSVLTLYACSLVCFTDRIVKNSKRWVAFWDLFILNFRAKTLL